MVKSMIAGSGGACLRCGSTAAEQPLDVAELELDVGRAAVVALAGIRRRLHLAQQRVHLVGLEAAAGAHRAVARHGGGDVQEAALEIGRASCRERGWVLGVVWSW